MQNAALEALGLAPEWSYGAIDVEPERFAARVEAMPGEGFAGANVTVPHKPAALAVAKVASDRAREIGSANTLSFAAGGIEADNTDAPGLIAALPRPPKGMRALVLGAGGSARAVVWALLGEGAKVELWNRTAERAEKLAGELGAEAVAAGDVEAGDYGLIVNTTTVGMKGEGLDELPLEAGMLGPGRVVVDLPYSGSETELVAAARDAGAEVVDGLEILVRQGAESLRIWTREDPPLDVMREAARGD